MNTFENWVDQYIMSRIERNMAPSDTEGASWLHQTVKGNMAPSGTEGASTN